MTRLVFVQFVCIAFKTKRVRKRLEDATLPGQVLYRLPDGCVRGEILITEHTCTAFRCTRLLTTRCARCSVLQTLVKWKHICHHSKCRKNLKYNHQFVTILVAAFLGESKMVNCEGADVWGRTYGCSCRNVWYFGLEGAQLRCRKPTASGGISLCFQLLFLTTKLRVFNDITQYELNVFFHCCISLFLCIKSVSFPKWYKMMLN